ncbi:uroporphyrin-III C-methyltransferase/precorrin-2 dehydrogenase/sirohydrochlorin ferrochelatase [Porphyrobacter sp. MBR-155]|jgi:uroporphyrin-III C-methyltransferase/precorrin-2 dehydrogenase/sirohydrochlorin ferrochelatase|uniref:precorrin-2 dehydrogenase/sirohydrochlorin ferrochelatase family protein n=1 Tax=Porphyrobacter sp. MBR-155 TaxID=3156464 RepID=UPI003398B7C4
MSTIASLPLFHQITGQNVLVLGEGPAAEPKRRLVERAGGVVVDDLARAVDEGVRIAFIAYDDARACEVAAINARCAGMLVNVVDRPELCDFTTPSILDRSPLLVAIGTGGASAGLAKHVRLRLERVLPATLGLLARALEAARPALRRRFPDGAERRRAVDAALREGCALDPLNTQSFERVEAWLAGEAEAQTGAIFDLTLTSADPDDLTLRQARWLGEADVLVLDGAVPPAILARARADAARRMLGANEGGQAGVKQESGPTKQGSRRGKAGSRTGKEGSSLASLDSTANFQADNAHPTGLTLILRWRPDLLDDA